MTLTFDELECDLEKFKEELKSKLDEPDSELESELGGRKRSSSMANLPTLMRIKSEL